MEQLTLDNINQYQQNEKECFIHELEVYGELALECRLRYRFTSRQDLIDWLKGGKKLYQEDDNGYMEYVLESNQVLHNHLEYDNWGSEPAGTMNTDYMTWEEFMDWSTWMDDKSELQRGTIPYWRKGYEDIKDI